jgi:uncharacterized membrane protein YbhN (UPF0104 family)
VKSLLWGLARVALVLVLLGLLGRHLWRNWDQVKDAQITLRPVPFGLSVVVLAGCFLLYAWGFTYVLKRLGYTMPFGKGFKIANYSQLGKYVPGKLMVIVCRAYLANKVNVPPPVTVAATAIEQVFAVIAAALSFLLSLYLSPAFADTVPMGRAFALLAVCVVLVQPAVVNASLNFVTRRLHAQSHKVKLNYGDLLPLTSLYVAMWLLWGISLYFLIDSLRPTPPSQIPLIAGAFSMAWLFGAIAFVVPAGLGARESMFALLLSSVFPSSFATLVALLSRLWITAVELALILIATRIKL